MTPKIFFGNEAIVVNEILVSRVVRWINQDALHLTGKYHPQIAQGVEVVALNDEIPPRRIADGVLANEIERHEVIVQRLVPLNLVGLPDQTEARRVALIARFKEAEQFFPVKMIVT